MKNSVLFTVAVLMLGACVEATMTAKDEAEEVMNALLPFAEEMLVKHGEFYPFAGAMMADGEIHYIGGYTGDEQPPSQEIIDLLKDGFRAACP